MNKILKSFTDKRFKYGSYSTIIGIVVVAILIAINLVVGQFELKYDLTDTGMYSISDTTKEIIGGLDKKVTIYALYKTGGEEVVFTQLLDQYKNNSANIEVVYKDPYLYPQFAQQYKTEEGEDISVNSLIVESEKRSKVIDAADMFESNYNPYTGETQTTGLQFESVLTSAIKYVTIDKLPVIYNVTNHGEDDVPDRLKGQLETANYELKELNLFNIDEIPSDCTIIMMTTPQRDYNVQEAETVKKYLASDGRAIVLMNYTPENMPNMQRIISGYGVQADRAIIVEGDAQYCYQGRPTFLLPKLTEHSVNSGITNKGYAMLIPLAQSLSETELKKSSVSIDKLILSSEFAYSKNSPESQSINKEADDKQGPFDIAVAVTDSTYTDTNHTTKLVVVGSSDFIKDEMNDFVSNSNNTFFIGALTWLNDSEQESVYIGTKDLSAESIMIDTLTGLEILAVICVIIPFGLFITGFIVWFRRRNK